MASWEGKSNQNRSKIDPNTHQTNEQKKEGFRTVLEGFWGGPGGEAFAGAGISGPLRKVGSMGKEVTVGK